MSRTLTSTIFCLCALSAPVSAQDRAAIFDRLQGEWTGEGTLMGRAATYSMMWRNGDGFAVLEFSNGFAGTNGTSTPVLNSVAVYRTSSTNREAVWLDSRPERIDITWESTDGALVANWTSPTERGRTTYRVHSATEVEVVDEVWNGEGLRLFGRARYRRAPNNRQ